MTTYGEVIARTNQDSCHKRLCGMSLPSLHGVVDADMRGTKHNHASGMQKTLLPLVIGSTDRYRLLVPLHSEEMERTRCLGLVLLKGIIQRSSCSEWEVDCDHGFWSSASGRVLVSGRVMTLGFVAAAADVVVASRKRGACEVVAAEEREHSRARETRRGFVRADPTARPGRRAARIRLRGYGPCVVTEQEDDSWPVVKRR